MGEMGTSVNGNGRGRLEIWLPAAVMLCGGLVAWGAFTARVEDMGRRVSMLEQSQSARTADETRVLERLSSIEATMTAMRSQLGDVADQLRGRAR